MSNIPEATPTPQSITLQAIESIRSAFMEGRKGISRSPADDLAAWQQSDAKRKLAALSRATLAVFVKGAENQKGDA